MNDQKKIRREKSFVSSRIVNRDTNDTMKPVQDLENDSAAGVRERAKLGGSKSHSIDMKKSSLIKSGPREKNSDNTYLKDVNAKKIFSKEPWPAQGIEHYSGIEDGAWGYLICFTDGTFYFDDSFKPSDVEIWQRWHPFFSEKTV